MRTTTKQPATPAPMVTVVEQEDDVDVAAFESTADVVAYLWAKLGTPTIQG